MRNCILKDLQICFAIGKWRWDVVQGRQRWRYYFPRDLPRISTHRGKTVFHISPFLSFLSPLFHLFFFLSHLFPPYPCKSNYRRSFWEHSKLWVDPSRPRPKMYFGQLNRPFYDNCVPYLLSSLRISERLIGNRRLLLPHQVFGAPVWSDLTPSEFHKVIWCEKIRVSRLLQHL